MLMLALVSQWPPGRLSGIRSTLGSSCRGSALAKQGFESQECSFLERALATDDASAFRSIDVDEDGAQDIIHVGSAHCAEGNATVIWFAGRVGSRFGNPSPRTSSVTAVQSESV